MPTLLIVEQATMTMETYTHGYFGALGKATGKYHDNSVTLKLFTLLRVANFATVVWGKGQHLVTTPPSKRTTWSNIPYDCGLLRRVKQAIRV